VVVFAQSFVAFLYTLPEEEARNWSSFMALENEDGSDEVIGDDWKAQAPRWLMQTVDKPKRISDLAIGVGASYFFGFNVRVHILEQG
jgi:hypothetical protein